MIENLSHYWDKADGKTKKKILGCIFTEKFETSNLLKYSNLVLFSSLVWTFELSVLGVDVSSSLVWILKLSVLEIDESSSLDEQE